MNFFKSEAINELAAALAKAQSAFPAIDKKRTAKIPMKAGGQYTYQYADLADVLKACLPELAKNGLSITQLPTATSLVTILMHSSGQHIGSEMPLLYFDKVQETGSLLTYLRRYSITALIGVHADEDEDGNIANNAEPPKARPQPSGKMPEGFKPKEAQPYTIPFGTTHKGKTLEQVGITDLIAYIGEIDKRVEATGKPLVGEVKDFVDRAVDFINNFERQYSSENNFDNFKP